MWDVLRFANHQVDEECQNNTVPVSGQITIIHKPELRAFEGIAFGVTLAEVTILCPAV